MGLGTWGSHADAITKASVRAAGSLAALVLRPYGAIGPLRRTRTNVTYSIEGWMAGPGDDSPPTTESDRASGYPSSRVR